MNTQYYLIKGNYCPRHRVCIFQGQGAEDGLHYQALKRNILYINHVLLSDMKYILPTNG